MVDERFWFRLALVIGIGTVVGAVVVRFLRVDPGSMGPPYGVLVLATALMALLSGIASFIGWGRAVAAAAAVIALGGTAEILGLYLGVPFGRYAYSDWWLPSVSLPGGKVYPLLLPVTWFLIVASCYLALARRLRGVALIAGTAALAALVDLVIEAVLTNVVRFWTWLEPTPLLGAPYSNLVGWLLVAGVAAACLEALDVDRAAELPHPPWMLAAGAVCTAVIGLTHGEPRGALALLLLPVAWWTGRAPNSSRDPATV